MRAKHTGSDSIIDIASGLSGAVRLKDSCGGGGALQDLRVLQIGLNQLMPPDVPKSASRGQAIIPILRVHQEGIGYLLQA